MNRIRKLTSTLLLSGAALLGAAGVANASIIPVLQSVTAEGGNYRYTYQATLDGDQGLTAGSKLSIFDFAGYVAGSITATGVPGIGTFLGSTELVSNMIAAPGRTDDGAVPNLVFTWSGQDYRTSGGEYGPTQFTLTALSTLSGINPDGFSALAIKNNGAEQGTLTANVGSVSVPAVPEPSTWLMMILGVGAVGFAIRRQRKTVGGMTAA